MDAQLIVDTVAALDEDTALAIVTSILQSRPEIAPAAVAYAVPDLTYPPSKAMTERRSRGVIKGLNPDKGFGFIECPEIKEVFGSDVFLHMKQANGVETGESVSFAIMLNKDNRPQAYDVMSDMKGGGKGWGGKAMMGGCGGKGDGKGCGKVPDEELGQFDGIIKSFNPTSGYGFISCPGLSSVTDRDVFLHQKQLGDFQVGASITFTAFTHRGQFQAKDLAPYGESAKRIQLPGMQAAAAAW